MRNCVENDYPFIEMLRHHLPLADEIIVNEGYSTDGTFDMIRDLDPKIKIFRTKWDKPSGEHWWIHFKDAARRQCTGDWCIHLDSDEFIPDWEFEAIRRYLSDTSSVMVPVNFMNFWGNHRVYHADPGKVHWITRKMIIHRNLPDAIEFWGDGSNVKLKGQEFSWNTSDAAFTVAYLATSGRTLCRLFFWELYMATWAIESVEEWVKGYNDLGRLRSRDRIPIALADQDRRIRKQGHLAGVIGVIVADPDIFDLLGLHADLCQLIDHAFLRRDIRRRHSVPRIPQQVVVAMLDQIAAVDELQLQVAIGIGVREALVDGGRRLGRAAIEARERHIRCGFRRFSLQGGCETDDCAGTRGGRK
jgi:hypothetical protein